MSESLLIARSTESLYRLARMANRHGLVAGATGTGKTVNLHGMAEAFSRIGVPEFSADVMGDISAISQEARIIQKSPNEDGTGHPLPASPAGTAGAPGAPVNPPWCGNIPGLGGSSGGGRRCDSILAAMVKRSPEQWAVRSEVKLSMESWALLGNAKAQYCHTCLLHVWLVTWLQH